MTETVKIRMVVDTGEASKNIKGLRKDMDQTRKASDSSKDTFRELSQVLGRFNPILGALSQSMSKLRPAFSSFMGAFKGSKNSMATTMSSFWNMRDNIEKTGKATVSTVSSIKTAFSSLSSGFASALAAVNPVILALVAVGAAIMVIKTGWETMKNSFKAFDPQGYAKLFGTMERALRRIRTQIGYLSAGPVKVIMTTIVGILAVVEDILDAIIEFDKWIKSIQSDLGPVLDILWEILQVASPFFRLMDYFFDRGSEVLKDAAETLTDAVSAGLAGFDKLNSFKLGEGDADKINEINGNLEKETESAADNAEVAKGLWEEILGNTKTVFDWWGAIGTMTGAWFSTLGKGIGDVWGNVTAQFNDFWMFVTKSFGDMWSTFAGIAGVAWSAVTSFVSDFANTAGNILGGIWDGFKKTALGVFDWLSSNLGSILDGAISGIQGFVSDAQDTFNQVVNTVTGGGSGHISDSNPSGSLIDNSPTATVEKVKEVLSNVGNTIKDVYNSVKSKVSSIFTSSSSDTGKTTVKTSGGAVNTLIDLAKSFIGSFATGGVFMPNSPQLAVLGDNKAEPEVAAPYSMIVKAVQEAIGATSGTSAGDKVITINVPVEIDGRQVARASYDYIENERIRRNRSGAI